MTTPHDHHPTDADPTALGDRLERATNECESRATGLARRHKLHLWAGVLLIAFCTIGLARVTFLTGKLDAKTLTQIGRIEVERQLPDSRRALQSHLKENAPRFVREAIHGSLNLLPSAREHLVRTVEGRLQAAVRRGESDFEAQLVEHIRASKASIDASSPGSTDAEKLESLVQAVCARFDQNVTSCLDGLYPEFDAEITRVHERLHDLSDVDDDKLTKRERTEKRLIQTFLRLMLAEQTAGTSS